MTAKQQAVAENIQTFTHNLVILKLPRGPLKFNLVSSHFHVNFQTFCIKSDMKNKPMG